MLNYFFPALTEEGTRKLLGAGLGFEDFSSGATGVSPVSASESCSFFAGGEAPRGGNSVSEITVDGSAAGGALGVVEAMGGLLSPFATGTTCGSCCAIIGMVANGIPGCPITGGGIDCGM